MKKRNPVPAAERKALIVQTVIRLAAERNPEEITTAAMAEAMGLTQGALFRHFPTKEAIRAEVMEWTAEHLLEAVRTATEGVSDPLLALEAAFHAHLAFTLKFPGVPRILFSELQKQEQTPVKQAARNLMKQYSRMICDWIAQGKANGQIGAQLDERATAMAMIGLIQGLIMQSLLAGKPAAARQQADATFAIFRRGIIRR
jgi:TetR/AcrR family transcriptional regulator